MQDILLANLWNVKTGTFLPQVQVERKASREDTKVHVVIWKSIRGRKEISFTKKDLFPSISISTHKIILNGYNAVFTTLCNRYF